MDLGKNPLLPPGTWNLWNTGKRRILFACPVCGDVGLITQEVADDGWVSTNVRCPGLYCTFDERVRLVGWVPEKDEGLETKVFGP